MSYTALPLRARAAAQLLASSNFAPRTQFPKPGRVNCYKRSRWQQVVRTAARRMAQERHDEHQSLHIANSETASRPDIASNHTADTRKGTESAQNHVSQTLLLQPCCRRIIQRCSAGSSQLQIRPRNNAALALKCAHEGLRQPKRDSDGIMQGAWKKRFDSRVPRHRIPTVKTDEKLEDRDEVFQNTGQAPSSCHAQILIPSCSHKLAIRALPPNTACLCSEGDLRHLRVHLFSDGCPTSSSEGFEKSYEQEGPVRQHVRGSRCSSPVSRRV